MKDKILSLLRNSTADVSGEELSKQLGISRAAIGKHIKTLRHEGYIIQASTKTGYHFCSAPNTPYSAEISPYLTTSTLGREIHFLAEVDSTNTVAKKMAENNSPEGTVIIADHQTAGKGRLGRNWSSPPGEGLWMSIIFRPPLLPIQASCFPLVTAIAVKEALDAIGIDAKIKWPNDLLLGKKKICGILSEIRANMDGVDWLVLGLGININTTDFPADIKDIATSLQIASGKEISRPQIAAGILNNLEHNYSVLCQEGFAPLRLKWKEYSCTLQQEVTLTQGNTQITGIAVDIDEQGFLLVQEHQGQVKSITAGDVTLRK